MKDCKESFFLTTWKLKTLPASKRNARPRSIEKSSYVVTSWPFKSQNIIQKSDFFGILLSFLGMFFKHIFAREATLVKTRERGKGRLQN